MHIFITNANLLQTNLLQTQIAYLFAFITNTNCINYKHKLYKLDPYTNYVRHT